MHFMCVVPYLKQHNSFIGSYFILGFVDGDMHVSLTCLFFMVRLFYTCTYTRSLYISYFSCYSMHYVTKGITMLIILTHISASS